jgi:nitroreductase
MEIRNAYPQFYDLVSRRYSCRNYTNAPVSRDLLVGVLDLARLAPSACNRQPWKFLVIDTPELLEVVKRSYPREWMKNVPVCIVALGEHGEAWHRGSDGKDHTDVDVSIAVEHICLGAAAVGLGTCWVCNFDIDTLKDGLGIPEDVEPIALIPIGYPAGDGAVPEKNRKPLDEIVKWEKY